ncbi:MAG TPA: DUF924 family protein [Burkholderiales bacterium]|nr:DUF924 family protein [Burkholderiales bacterium]
MTEIDQVLEFWFGACGPDGALDRVKQRMWFSDGRNHDAVIRKKFGKLHRRAARGELDAEWAATPRGRIALIVLLDQFSRHIHRGKPAAFAQDPAAQRLAAAGLEQGVDRGLIPAQRAFFYLPFEHAEDVGLQRLGTRAFERLATEVAPAWRKEYTSFADYAGHHRDIIERFGRFPHRNAILGRASTPEEVEFLKEPGSSF